MHTDKSDLEPIDPRTAQELYLEQKATECAEATVRNHRYHTDKLVEWCEENDVDNLNELTGRNLQEICLWRKEVGDINLLTLNNHMSTLRVFLQWCASIEAVPETLYDKVMVPRVKPEDEQADDTLAADTAQEILEYLSTFHYASLDHVLFGVLWETGMRIGAARSIDTDDVAESCSTARQGGSDTHARCTELAVPTFADQYPNAARVGAEITIDATGTPTTPTCSSLNASTARCLMHERSSPSRSFATPSCAIRWH